MKRFLTIAGILMHVAAAKRRSEAGAWLKRFGKEAAKPDSKIGGHIVGCEPACPGFLPDFNLGHPPFPHGVICGSTVAFGLTAPRNPQRSGMKKPTNISRLAAFVLAGAVFLCGARVMSQTGGESEPNRYSAESFRIGAEKGDADAQFALAEYLRIRNPAEGVKWYGKAAEQGHASAQFWLAECYAKGTGVAKNAVEAVKWYGKAAEQGHSSAQFSLAMCYANGTGVAKNAAEAVKRYGKLAEQGDMLAQFELGECYGNGTGVARNAVEAAKWYGKAAQQGLYFAQVKLGECYAKGTGVGKDKVEALKWWLVAAKDGATSYTTWTGTVEEFGDKMALLEKQMTEEKVREARKRAFDFMGIRVPLSKAEKEEQDRIRASAEKGDPAAQYSLAQDFFVGRGVPQDILTAVEWLTKAADQGYVVAQRALGDFYCRTPPSPEGVKWYRAAADQGDAAAQVRLGMCYDDGRGVPQDSVAALTWYRKAAEQGDPSGQCILANRYFYGEGVVKDEVEAYKWWLLAAGQGNEWGKRGVASSEKRLTREQIAEGQKLARNFKPSKANAAGTPVPGAGAAGPLPKATGTGFFITDGGFLVTNRHLVEGASQVRLATNAGLIAAKVIKVDAASDLALLKAEGKFAALAVTPSHSVRLGASVATVGFPNIGMQGQAPKLAKGEIAALSGAADDARYFQVSVPVQPGNSGGALVDERGNVVGVVSAKLDAATALATSGALPENVNYAVKSSFLLGFLESAPEVFSQLKQPNTREEKFENVVQSAERAAVLIVVY